MNELDMILSIDYLKDNLVLALTGSTMALIGGGSMMGYKTWKTGFRYKNKLQNKYDALGIFLLSIFVSSFATFIVNQIWLGVTNNITFIQTISAILIVGMISLNFMVSGWRQDDQKSINVHCLAIAITAIEYLLNM
ncbi:MAG: hypothetical protein CI953_1578 [Methanohalophilus sp.]|jgi:hypothetical protein|nr:MAG: hypothetical protein CI953_1578 [Methanohalophilus sp.]